MILHLCLYRFLGTHKFSLSVLHVHPVSLVILISIHQSIVHTRQTKRHEITSIKQHMEQKNSNVNERKTSTKGPVVVTIT